MEKESSRFVKSTIFEGATSISAVVDAYGSKFNNRRIDRILYDTARSDKLSRTIAYFKHRGDELGFSVIPTDSAVIDSLTLGTTHGGLIAECTQRTLPTVSELSPKEYGFYVMLEGIEDPYNFGYALRTLYAAGADGVILSPRNWMSAAGVVCRSSAGASELLPSYVGENDDIAACFKSHGYKIVCAGIRDSVSVYDAELKKPLLLIVGGEKRGISRAMLEHADITVRLEYGRDFGGSLSAASAASVLAYEIYRQNRCKQI